MNMQSLKKNLNDTLLSLPFIFSFAFIIFFEGSSKVLVITTLLSLLCYVVVFRQKATSFIIKNIRQPFHILLWVFALFVFFQAWLNGVASREIRTILCLSLIALYFPFLAIRSYLYQIMIILGCCSVFINSAYFNIYLGLSRKSGVINSIPYAGIAALLALWAIHFSLSSQNKRTKVFFGFLSILPMISLALTQSRGVWIAFLCALVVLTWRQYKLNVKKTLILGVSIIVATFMFSNSFIEKRIEKTQYEFEQIRQGNMNTSIGLRLQMWEASLKLADGNWWLGLGKRHYSKLDQLYKQHEISKSLFRFNPAHYHNQFIDSIVKSGIIGLFFLLLLFLLPLYLVRTSDKNTKNMVRAVIILYIIMGLTDVPFYNGQTFILYVFTILILLGRNNQPENQNIFKVS